MKVQCALGAHKKIQLIFIKGERAFELYPGRCVAFGWVDMREKTFLA